MKIHDLVDNEGRVFAFEVDNLFVGRLDVCNIVASIPGSNIVRRPRRFSWFREEVFCEFEIDGIRFTVWEPFGDSNSYWIGPEPPNWVSQITVVREAFLKA